MSLATQQKSKHSLDFLKNKTQVINDYRIAHESRQVSLIGRREVLTGKAKFGIFGDGKEVAQLAMARQFKKGDWRAGYYRDQTFMLAAGLMSLEEFFAQLYGDNDLKTNPANGGRMMNNHFATRSLDERGEWKNLMQQKNVSADISPTAGQMPRLLGLGLASKIFRNEPVLSHLTQFSNKGNEVAFGTIGDSSTSEGHFWETMNAAGVMQVPIVMSVWDDGYGISVSRRQQTIKDSISESLRGFETDAPGRGIKIFVVKGWDYEALNKTYEEAVAHARKNHMPVLVHVIEVTQPQGHSTSGSHERYKSPERLQWESDYDGLVKFREWILKNRLAEAAELNQIEQEAVKKAREARRKAWNHYIEPLKTMKEDFLQMVDVSGCSCAKSLVIEGIKNKLAKISEPSRKDILSTGKQILRKICDSCSNPENSLKSNVTQWLDKAYAKGHKDFNTHLLSDTAYSPLKVQPIAPEYEKHPEMVPGREILRDNFKAIFEKYPEALIFGEDVGKIGGVNQTLEGLQEIFGANRIADTGIRETTIIGQAIGMAMRGLRPIAEIQYFDYLLYGLQTVSDDLATLRWRSAGGQKAPMIISTRGHRLEGVWHSGSPLSMVINSIRGVHVIVPRNMTQAAGFYNTIMEGDDPALIIEPLNGYRLREPRPKNIGAYKIALGQPEVLRQGTDVTLVSYGSCIRIAEYAAAQLKEFDISVELIDVQTLLPFDISQTILTSLKKTNKIIFFDEDVPGGTTAFMMQKVLEEQKGFFYLDAAPRTVTAVDNRPAYGTDGDYFSNPNAENVFDAVYNLMHEYNPGKFPKIF
jgi:pyruvate/2-oxoglutarate/acetoin dehydrogenase E1 component/TPP-dependent pyruvate/acetoin dehydrogenase alpha subunit